MTIDRRMCLGLLAATAVAPALAQTERKRTVALLFDSLISPLSMFRDNRTVFLDTELVPRFPNWDDGSSAAVANPKRSHEVRNAPYVRMAAAC